MLSTILSGALALSEVAPVVARWLGGSYAEDVATHVVDTAKRLTGQDNTEDMVATLRNDPKLLIEFHRDLMALDMHLESQIIKDRQDARLRDIAMLSKGSKNWRADIMVLAAAGGLIACLGVLGFYKDALPGEAVGILSTVAGIFGSCLKDAYAFEFGSSRGSKTKDAHVAAILGKSYHLGD